jgi:signal peptidase
MKKTFACPKCKIHKTIGGKQGERRILICDNCGCKGRATFPLLEKKQKRIKISKKQLIALSIGLTIFLLFLLMIFIPTINGEMHFLTVQSGSMEPKIHVGDVVVSTQVDPDEIKAGDVITFHYTNDEDPNRCFTHRVEKVIDTRDGYVFQTKGDANEDVDQQYVRPDEVIGRVSLVIPFLGHVGNFARSVYGFFLFIVIPALCIILFEIHRILKVRREEKISKKV